MNTAIVKGSFVRPSESNNTLTIGIDLGDRWGHYCVLDVEGEIVEEGRLRMTRSAFTAHFTGPRARIAIETGAHSTWVNQHLSELGHEVIVANARELRAISGSNSKHDAADAEKLARYARVDPRILRPIQHRNLETQADLVIIRARAAGVRARTQLVNAARGMVKAFGFRLPSCSTRSFARKEWTDLPANLNEALRPLFHAIEALSQQIKEYERRIALLAHDRYPETARLQQINGVGSLTALTFVLTLSDKHRFAKSRDVGCYLGLRPRRYQSGAHDPELGITKAGDSYLRSLLVECSQRLLGHFGRDSVLRRWGLKLAQRGGKNARKHAIVAVARKLAILLHRLWVSGEVYQPFYGMNAQPATA
jgi:transposase